MTEAADTTAGIEEALHLIERGLGEFSDRQLLSSSEVFDLLLDVRSALLRDEPSPN